MKDYELLTCGKCGNQWKVAKNGIVEDTENGRIRHTHKSNLLEKA